MSATLPKRLESFSEFYPVYLDEHEDRRCRQLHFAGATLALLCLAALLVTGDWDWLAAALVAGYGLAWAGHALFENNQPSSLRQPGYAFIAYWVMYWQMATGQVSF